MEQQTETPVEISSEAITPPAPMSEEQNALLVYQSKINTFIHKLNNYSGSKKQIARAWTNAAIHPMNKEDLHFSYPEEKELFDLFDELNSAKFVLMLYGAIREGSVQLIKPLTDVAPVQEEKKEESNGS